MNHSDKSDYSDGSGDSDGSDSLDHSGDSDGSGSLDHSGDSGGSDGLDHSGNSGSLDGSDSLDHSGDSGGLGDLDFWDSSDCLDDSISASFLDSSDPLDGLDGLDDLGDSNGLGWMNNLDKFDNSKKLRKRNKRLAQRPSVRAVWNDRQSNVGVPLYLNRGKFYQWIDGDLFELSQRKRSKKKWKIPWRFPLRHRGGELEKRLRQAARAGDHDASYQYGLLCTKGHECSASVVFRYFYLAARCDHVEAMFRVAMALERGYGTRMNPGRAMFWYRRAAVAGHCGAIRRLEKEMEKEIERRTGKRTGKSKGKSKDKREDKREDKGKGKREADRDGSADSME